MKKFLNQNVPPGFEGELKNIAVDFDGVVHNFNKGWHDGTCYGDPIEGSLEALKSLSQKYNVIIFSAKVRPDRPLVDGKTGTELVDEWLIKHDVRKYVTEITHEKPRAEYYIDDKAIRFTNNWSRILDRVLVGSSGLEYLEGPQFLNSNPYENGEFDFFKKIVEGVPDFISHVIDVGAGNDSTFLAYDGTVHYFEPTDKLDELKTKECVNYRSTWNKMGLSNTNEKNKLITWETGGVLPQTDGTLVIKSSDVTTTMPTRRGEDFIRHLEDIGQDSRVDFIKIDTEGHELDVLKGFGEKIKDIKLVQFEYGTPTLMCGYGFLDIFNYLNSYEFDFPCYLAPGGVLIPIETNNFEEHYSYCNILIFNMRDFKLTRDKKTGKEQLFPISHRETNDA